MNQLGADGKPSVAWADDPTHPLSFGMKRGEVGLVRFSLAIKVGGGIKLEYSQIHSLRLEFLSHSLIPPQRL